MNYGLVVAAGKAGKMGGNVDRAFLSLGPRPVLAYSLLAFEACEDIDGVIVVVRKDRVDGAGSMAQLFGCSKVMKVIPGAALRQTSVLNGLKAMPEDAKFVTIHEASRPCITPEMISETLQAAKRGGAAAVALKISDAVVHSERGTTVAKSVDNSKLWSVQTPQSFKVDVLKRAVNNLATKKKSVVDEATAVELLGESVRLVPGSPMNIKIATADDLPLAATLLKL